MSALATTGAVWQIFLESRLASLESVHAWSEGWIEALMDSPQWLIELASATSIADALSVLNGPTGEIDARRVWPECAARLADALDGDPTTRQMIAQALYFLADDERYVRPEIALEMRSFSDECTLAEEGVYGVAEDVRSRLATFLDRHRCRDESRDIYRPKGHEA